ncbi:hypothetical protein PG2000B_1119 [Bifidobacterium pseudolongum subsp. globosum]|uniref:hypothetical protein n=1 Tax=Bifidobacterium pseudolongum TaxID=1694 RepID=UPI001020E5AC|nr:hypothetical protein [Bifidobacterium pseudolongum]RYQ42426.1 hypothetical protein PG2000B_1119 [Bifidobacterium pseudolongum subsp. globosum]
MGERGVGVLMAGEPVWPDWGEFITQDREHINQLRGMSQPQQPTQPQPTRMGESDMEIAETELREMARTPWHDLAAGQQRVVLAHLCGTGKSTARTGLRDALNMNPTRTAMELWEIQQAAGATVAPTMPVRWEPGMLVEKLPEDLHHARVVISDAQKTARAAHEHPGLWVVYGVSDGEHARRIALEKVRRVVRAKTSAFAPAASFEAQAREVEPGRYVVFCRYVGAEQ